jgi:hypothetical protein
MSTPLPNNKCYGFSRYVPSYYKIIINEKTVEQVQTFNLSYSYEKHLEQKLSTFQHECATIQRTLKDKIKFFGKN